MQGSMAGRLFAIANEIRRNKVLAARMTGRKSEETVGRANEIIIDNVRKQVVRTEYKDDDDGNYSLCLYLSTNECVEVQWNTNVHADRTVGLVRKEENHSGFYWVVDYYATDGRQVIDTVSDPHLADVPVFLSGSLKITGTPETVFSLHVENGRVAGADAKEHTLSISYLGKPMKSE